MGRSLQSARTRCLCHHSRFYYYYCTCRIAADGTSAGHDEGGEKKTLSISMNAAKTTMVTWAVMKMLKMMKMMKQQVCTASAMILTADYYAVGTGSYSASSLPLLRRRERWLPSRALSRRKQDRCFAYHPFLPTNGSCDGGCVHPQNDAGEEDAGKADSG